MVYRRPTQLSTRTRNIDHRRRWAVQIGRGTRVKIVMTAPTSPRSVSRDQVRAHRERLRRRGMRPIQIWVPDLRASRRIRADNPKRRNVLIGMEFVPEVHAI